MGDTTLLSPYWGSTDIMRHRPLDCNFQIGE